MVSSVSGDVSWPFKASFHSWIVWLKFALLDGSLRVEANSSQALSRVASTICGGSAEYEEISAREQQYAPPRVSDSRGDTYLALLSQTFCSGPLRALFVDDEGLQPPIWPSQPPQPESSSETRFLEVSKRLWSEGQACRRSGAMEVEGTKSPSSNV